MAAKKYVAVQTIWDKTTDVTTPPGGIVEVAHWDADRLRYALELGLIRAADAGEDKQ